MVPLTNFFESSKVTVNMTSSKFKNYIVIEEATRQKQELKNTLKNRFLFLKMDGWTRHKVNYFAINARFTNDDNKVVTKTLAIKDTHANHTSE